MRSAQQLAVLLLSALVAMIAASAAMAEPQQAGACGPDIICLEGQIKMVDPKTGRCVCVADTTSLDGGIPQSSTTVTGTGTTTGTGGSGDGAGSSSTSSAATGSPSGSITSKPVTATVSTSAPTGSSSGAGGANSSSSSKPSAAYKIVAMEPAFYSTVLAVVGVLSLF